MGLKPWCFSNWPYTLNQWPVTGPWLAHTPSWTRRTAVNGLNLDVSSLFTTCLIRCLATQGTRISTGHSPHRTMINHSRRETQSEYSIRHTFGWTQGGMTYDFLITGYCFPCVFCPVSSRYPISIACADCFSHVYNIIACTSSHLSPTNIWYTGSSCLFKVLGYTVWER